MTPPENPIVAKLAELNQSINDRLALMNESLVQVNTAINDLLNRCAQLEQRDGELSTQVMNQFDELTLAGRRVGEGVAVDKARLEELAAFCGNRFEILDFNINQARAESLPLKDAQAIVEGMVAAAIEASPKELKNAKKLAQTVVDNPTFAEALQQFTATQASGTDLGNLQAQILELQTQVTVLGQALDAMSRDRASLLDSVNSIQFKDQLTG
jgi:hypothetical protein